jgi:hypothetical protein
MLIGVALGSWNHGQACCAGSRIFVQAGIYDEFLKRFTARTEAIRVGDPFGEGVDQGPQISQIQYDVRAFPHLPPSSSWVIVLLPLWACFYSLLPRALVLRKYQHDVILFFLSSNHHDVVLLSLSLTSTSSLPSCLSRRLHAPTAMYPSLPSFPH